MGCRTRTFENINGYKTPVGRGNISFTAMNLSRLAIEAVKEVKEENLSYDDFLKKVSASLYENIIRTYQKMNIW
ncbi:hypothetical protein P344_00850 [Spiroplasma mirum ATCC 29335]|uniref:Uncharacterized protein n=2 Tax=Spiroplasma mirum TaxID=2144 RepID=W6AJQ1_9MOLU|nr:hypothetical protein P344_00850 [Spiroplasma mirum ATCC 29335]